MGSLAGAGRRGMGRAELGAVVGGYRREIWLWLTGERTWAQCCAGLIGRARRRRLGVGGPEHQPKVRRARPGLRVVGGPRRAGRCSTASDWAVGPEERWVVLGPNGSGKTTLLAVAGARLWPTGGDVEVLGQRLGRVDVRALRARVALVSGSVVRQLRPDLTRPRGGRDRPLRRARAVVARPTRRPSGPRPTPCWARPGWPATGASPGGPSG